jgi:hypothetical protein
MTNARRHICVSGNSLRMLVSGCPPVAQVYPHFRRQLDNYQLSAINAGQRGAARYRIDVGCQRLWSMLSAVQWLWMVMEGAMGRVSYKYFSFSFSGMADTCPRCRSHSDLAGGRSGR